MAPKKPTTPKIVAPSVFGLPAAPKKTTKQKATDAITSAQEKIAKAQAAIDERALDTQLRLKQAQSMIENPAIAKQPVNVAPSAAMPTSGFNYIDFISQYQQQYDFAGVTRKEDATPTSGRDIAKEILRSKGYPEEIVDSTLNFYDSVKQDSGLSEEAIDDIYFNVTEYKTKDGRSIINPFMSKYGKFIKASRENDLVSPLQGTEAIKYVEGIQNAVKTYNLNKAYVSDENIVQYIKNNIDIETFNNRLNEGKAATLTASDDYVQALQDQGFISGRADLINFFANPAMGEQIFKQNKISGIVGAAALKAKRETPGMQQSSIATAQEAAKNYVAKGYTEKEAARLAEAAYEQVQADLAPTLTASGIYETRGPDMGKTAAGQSLADLGRVGEIQSTLENEQLLGNMASKRRKDKLASMYVAGLSGSSGTAGSLSLGKNIQL